MTCEMVEVPREKLVSDISIALAVIRPPIQVGRGRKLPSQSERDRQWAAEMIVGHFERQGVRWFRPLPRPPQSYFPATKP
jgi:hypothetical protein